MLADLQMGRALRLRRASSFARLLGVVWEGSTHYWGEGL
jgi:hypothetical protein